MSNISGKSMDEADLVKRGELHTKCVTPRRLSRELKFMLGNDADYKVVVRHNVYNIESSTPFDLGKLLRNCKGFPLATSTAIEFEEELITTEDASERVELSRM